MGLIWVFFCSYVRSGVSAHVRLVGTLVVSVWNRHWSKDGNLLGEVSQLRGSRCLLRGRVLGLSFSCLTLLLLLFIKGREQIAKMIAWSATSGAAPRWIFITSFLAGGWRVLHLPQACSVVGCLSVGLLKPLQTTSSCASSRGSAVM